MPRSWVASDAIEVSCPGHASAARMSHHPEPGHDRGQRERRKRLQAFNGKFEPVQQREYFLAREDRTVIDEHDMKTRFPELDEEVQVRQRLLEPLLRPPDLEGTAGGRGTQRHVIELISDLTFSIKCLHRSRQ